jgi:hypothetical protein
MAKKKPNPRSGIRRQTEEYYDQQFPVGGRNAVTTDTAVVDTQPLPMDSADLSGSPFRLLGGSSGPAPVQTTEGTGEGGEVQQTAGRVCTPEGCFPRNSRVVTGMTRGTPQASEPMPEPIPFPTFGAVPGQTEATTIIDEPAPQKPQPELTAAEPEVVDTEDSVPGNTEGMIDPTSLDDPLLFPADAVTPQASPEIAEAAKELSPEEASEIARNTPEQPGDGLIIRSVTDRIINYRAEEIVGYTDFLNKSFARLQELDSMARTQQSVAAMEVLAPQIRHAQNLLTQAINDKSQLQGGIVYLDHYNSLEQQSPAYKQKMAIAAQQFIDSQRRLAQDLETSRAQQGLFGAQTSQARTEEQLALEEAPFKRDKLAAETRKLDAETGQIEAQTKQVTESLAEFNAELQDTTLAQAALHMKNNEPGQVANLKRRFFDSFVRQLAPNATDVMVQEAAAAGSSDPQTSMMRRQIDPTLLQQARMDVDDIFAGLELEVVMSTLPNLLDETFAVRASSSDMTDVELAKQDIGRVVDEFIDGKLPGIIGGLEESQQQNVGDPDFLPSMVARINPVIEKATAKYYTMMAAQAKDAGDLQTAGELLQQSQDVKAVIQARVTNYLQSLNTQRVSQSVPYLPDLGTGAFMGNQGSIDEFPAMGN